jgi:hypothetical protein
MLTILRSRASGSVARRVIPANAHASSGQSSRHFGTSGSLLRGEDWISGTHQQGHRSSHLARERGAGSRLNTSFRRDSRQTPSNFRGNYENRSRDSPRSRQVYRQAPSNSEVHDEILEGTAEKRDNYITEFADLETNGQVSPVLVNTITRNMGLKTMTPVQSKTINEALEGVDL